MGPGENTGATGPCPGSHLLPYNSVVLRNTDCQPGGPGQDAWAPEKCSEG